MPNSCVVYLQLLAGWLVLNLATMALNLIPHSALFFDLSGDVDDSKQMWTYSLWVLVQIILFFSLLVMATVLMCSCHNVPQEAGFVHLLVDPALVTLGCVPFLLITGLPRANYIENCLLNTTPASSFRPPNLTDDLHPMLGQIPLSHRYKPAAVSSPADCLYSQFYWTVNSSQVSGLFGGHNATVEQAQTLLSQWRVGIEMSVMLPVVLHLLHYHWRMSWQPFLQSNLYLLVQALDLVFFIDTAIYVSDPNMKLATETLTYISTLLLCVGCLTLSTPPIYVGNDVSRDYLRMLMAIGCVVIDIVHLLVRIGLLLLEPDIFSLCNQALFYILLLKNTICAAALVYYGLLRSPCIQPEYNSLNTIDPDDDDEIVEKEDFV